MSMLKKITPKYMAHIRPHREDDDYILLTDKDVEKMLSSRRCAFCSAPIHNSGLNDETSDTKHYTCNGCGRTTIVQIL